ncbi:MAG: hypothetical protein WBA57_02160 [Elainellaceae cyanobacterium]
MSKLISDLKRGGDRLGLNWVIRISEWLIQKQGASRRRDDTPCPFNQLRKTISDKSFLMGDVFTESC